MRKIANDVKGVLEQGPQVQAAAQLRWDAVGKVSRAGLELARAGVDRRHQSNNQSHQYHQQQHPGYNATISQLQNQLEHYKQQLMFKEQEVGTFIKFNFCCIGL